MKGFNFSVIIAFNFCKMNSLSEQKNLTFEELGSALKGSFCTDAFSSSVLEFEDCDDINDPA